MSEYTNRLRRLRPWARFLLLVTAAGEIGGRAAYERRYAINDLPIGRAACAAVRNSDSAVARSTNGVPDAARLIAARLLASARLAPAPRRRRRRHAGPDGARPAAAPASTCARRDPGARRLALLAEAAVRPPRHRLRHAGDDGDGDAADSRSSAASSRAARSLIVTAHPSPKGTEGFPVVRKPLDLARFVAMLRSYHAVGVEGLGRDRQPN